MSDETPSTSTGVRMHFAMSVHGPQSDLELRSLRRWLLRRRPELAAAGIAVDEEGPAPGDDEMGGVFEVVQFAVGASAELAALALAFVTWRQGHGARSSVTFERDGLRITLAGTDLDDEHTVRRALEALREDGDRPGGDGDRPGEDGDGPREGGEPS